MTHNVIMPDLGQTVAEGKILRWLKKPGDNVSRGEALLEVETDKVSMEVESYRSGYLRAILVAEGEAASAMSPIAILTDQADEALENRGDGGTTASGPDDSSRLRGADLSGGGGTVGSQASVAKSSVRVAATPAAKLRARELGVDLGLLAASMPDGLITRRAVEATLVRHSSSKPALAMAAVTTKSVQSVPHFYVTVDADVSALVGWRNRWNSEHPELHLSLNDIFVRTAALTLRDVPELNVRYLNGAVEQRAQADVLLVAALPRGLALVPIPDPALLTWEGCARLMRQALQTAGEGLAASPLEEGTPALGISNLGMFGVKQFTAIIPPDSAAIMAIGAVRAEAIVRNGRVEIGDVCTLTLAADHRVIDGVTAAKFLERIQAHLQAP